MDLFNSTFRQSPRQAPGDDLNAAVKSDFYVNAGDLENGGQRQVPPHSGYCASAFKRLCVRSPFAIFCTSAICWNVPAIILALTDLSVLSKGCHASIWLFVNGICACIHIAAAIYIAYSSVAPRAQQLLPEQKQPPEGENINIKPQQRETAFARAKNVFLTNPGVVCYMWFVLFYTAFSFMPLLIQFQGKAQNIIQKYSKNGGDDSGNDYNNANYYYGGDDAYNYNNTGSNSNNNNGDGYYGQDYDNGANANANNGSDSDYMTMQALKCSHFSHEKVIIAMGFAWAFLIMGLVTLAISFCVAYNADSVLNSDDDDAEGFGYFYQPPNSTSPAAKEQQHRGTFDDAEEASVPKLDDPVLASRVATSPLKQRNKEMSTQTSAVADAATTIPNAGNVDNATVITNRNVESANSDDVAKIDKSSKEETKKDEKQDQTAMAGNDDNEDSTFEPVDGPMSAIV